MGFCLSNAGIGAVTGPVRSNATHIRYLVPGRLCSMAAVSGSALGLNSDELKQEQAAERQCGNGK